jgi:hypothetical protein
MEYMNNKAAADAAWLARIHGVEPESEVDQTQTPDFDGGVREPAIAPGDPFEEHNQTVLRYLQETRGGW